MKNLHHLLFLCLFSVMAAASLSMSAAAADYGSDALNTLSQTPSETVNRADFLQAIIDMNGGVLDTFTMDDPQFVDVTPGEPSYQNFMEAAREEWYLGTGDCYGEAECYAYPHNAVQAQFFARVVVNAFGLDATGAAPHFADAPSNEVYAEALQIAADHCILLADEKGKVYPSSTMTKAQIIAALQAVDKGGTYGENCQFPGASGATSSSKNFWDYLFPSESSLSSAESDQATSSGTTGFKDLPADPDEREAILYVQSHGIVSGYDDGTYRPSAKINRAEFMKIVMNAVAPKKDIDACMDATVFSDVDTKMWFTRYICLGKKQKIIGGYADGTFRPTQNISFVEAAKILVQAFAIDASAKESAAAAWYVPFVKALEKKGAIPISIQSFSYTITRADMAQMIFRLHAHTDTKASLHLSQLQE